MKPKHKFDLIIPHRNRYDHLLTCLFYLNVANSIALQDVVIHVVDDSAEVQSFPEYKFLKVKHRRVPGSTSQPFQRARLLSLGLEHVRKNAEFLSFVDADMIHRSDLFYMLLVLFQGNDYIIGIGKRLNAEDSLNVIRNRPDFGEIDPSRAEDFGACPSQVTMTRDAYQLFRKVFTSTRLMSNAYSGWGAEDSELSYKSKLLEDDRLLRRAYLHDAWFHLDHPREFKRDLYERNFSTYLASKRAAEIAIKIYLSRINISEPTQVHTTPPVEP